LTGVREKATLAAGAKTIYMRTDGSLIPGTGVPLDSGARSASANGSGPIVEMEWDLQASLQLLANRACYVTGATMAIIALGEGDTLICKASSGKTAPDAGTQIQIDGGLTSELMAECVTMRLPVRCDNAANDARISAEESAKQGVGCALIVPLICGNEVVGIFQLTSDRNEAFEERDVASLSRLASAAQTALEDALVRVDGGLKTTDALATTDTSAPASEPLAARFSSLVLHSGRIPLPPSRMAQSLNDVPTRLNRGQDLQGCKGCGFPVSADRSLCIDCEAAEIAHGKFVERSPALYPFTSETKHRNWLDEHFYTIGIVLVSILTVIVLFLWAR